MFKLILLLSLFIYCETVYIYSSFWAPLFDPRILNYKVDAKFDAEVKKSDKEEYQKNYGVRGEKLIEDLGNGKYKSGGNNNKDYEEVKFYYTYPGAQNKK